MKTNWLKKMAACVAAMAILPLMADMPRSEWHAKVGDCAQNPAQLKETIAQLSPADQCAFLSEVNEALAKMPGSADAKAAAILAANRAAVTGATAENRAAVLAEVFATVPPEYLTVINANFASDLFNRNANPARTYSDAEYYAVCSNAMMVVIARNATAENAAARNAFAIMMFVRASGDAAPNADLISSLTSMMPEGGDKAKNEWIPEALSPTPSYDKILGDAQAGDEPSLPVTTTQTGMQSQEGLLADLAADKAADASSSGGGSNLFRGSQSIAGTAPANDNAGGYRMIPRSAILDKTTIDPKTGEEVDNPYYNKKRGDSAGGTGGGDEPGPYAGQN